jgi:hypothetical protein
MASRAKEDAAAGFAAFDLGNYDGRHSIPHRNEMQESSRRKKFQGNFFSIQNYFNPACFSLTGPRGVRFSRAADVLTFFSSNLPQQTKVHLSQRSRQITDAAAWLHRE